VTEEAPIRGLLAAPILMSLAHADGPDVGDVRLAALRDRGSYLGRAFMTTSRFIERYQPVGHMEVDRSLRQLTGLADGLVGSVACGPDASAYRELVYEFVWNALRHIDLEREHLSAQDIQFSGDAPLWWRHERLRNILRQMAQCGAGDQGELIQVQYLLQAWAEGQFRSAAPVKRANGF